MTTISQLEYLVAVVEERHFGRAAKRCHVSQPSLSQQIQKLEDELNLQVIDRNKKPITTTELGAAVVEQAKSILREHRKLKYVADASVSEVQGEFHLAVIPTVAQYLIPLFLSHFARHFPKVKLIVDEYKTSEIIDLLRREQIDAGLLVTPLREEGIIERTLFYEKFFAYCSPNHPLLKKKVLSEFDLDQSKIWLLGDGHCFRDQALKVCSIDRNQQGLRNIEFYGGSLETLRRLINTNEGYTLFPELATHCLSKDESRNQLREIADPCPVREVGFVHTRSFYKLKILEALQSSVLASLPKSLSLSKPSGATRVDI